MVVINNEKCNGCKICTDICHEHCMYIEDNLITIRYNQCSTCGQCVAICPRQALSWDNVQPTAFNKELLPSDKQVDELLKERRTVRDFSDRKIDKILLGEIINYGIYAPANSFDFRVIIVDDDEIKALIDKILMQVTLRIYNLIRYSILQKISRLISPVLEAEFIKAKSKISVVVERNTVFPTFPSAFIIIIADKRVPLSLESAQYALYNMNLYSQTKGLGCRNLVGNQGILNKNKSFRKRLGLKKNERICGMMGIGYPKFKFKNKVEGKKMSIQWNGVQN
jgi:NAD-dependent dihydropyrimidine dehydrogenase PreA subunit/nitroreductase